MSKFLVGILLTLILAPPSYGQSSLETPGPGSFQSGLGYVVGWKCTAGNLTFTIDNGPPGLLIYGASRGDTQGVCGDSNNGFITQFNWNLVGNGQHTIRVFDNGVQFSQATFTVTTLGAEFLTGQSATCNTSLAGQNVTLTWQQNQQNFAITGASGGGPFSGTYHISATKTSDTCGISLTGLVDTLTVSQDGSNLTGTIQSAPNIQYSGTVDASGNFTLTQTNPEQTTSGTCTFQVGSSFSGNFNSGSVTSLLSRRQVSGSCPLTVNCDISLSGTLTKTSAVQSEASEYMPFGEGEGSSVDELIDSLSD